MPIDRLCVIPIALLSLLLFAASASAQIDPSFDAVGPIDVQNRYQRPSVAAYVHLEAGERLQVFVEHVDPDAATYGLYHLRSPRAVVRVTGPDDDLLEWHVVDAGVDPSVYPELAAADLAGGVLLNRTYTARSTGVHVVRVGAGYEHTKLHLGLPPGRAHALSYGNAIWQAWRGSSAASLSLWVPAHATEEVTIELRWIRGRVSVSGDGWSHTLEQVADETVLPFVRTLAPGTGGELWRIDGLTSDWQMRAGGDVPIIFATTPEHARAVDASLLSIDEGPYRGSRFPHEFQRHLAVELIPRLLREIGDTTELLSLVADRLASPACAAPADPATAWWADQLVRRDIPTVAWALENWRFGADATEHPFVDAEHGESIAPIMARLRGFAHPCNPWGPTSEGAGDGRAGLLVRALLVGLAQMMTITEDERLLEGRDAFSNYPTSSTFRIGDRVWPFAMVVRNLEGALPPDLAEDVLRTYREGMRRLAVDRRFAEEFVSARNQSSLFVMSHGAVALGDQDGGLEVVARAYAERFSASRDPSGYFDESLGPDATYNGITHSELASYYLMSSWMPGCTDPNVRAAIQDSYRFFNATVAPEPNGTMFGGFNFSHRTMRSFAMEQYRGARNRARDIPEVAIWTEPSSPSLAELQGDLDEAIGRYDEWVDRVPRSVSTVLGRWRTSLFAEVFDFASDHGTMAWPAEDGRTDRLYSDEMYAVRRAGYYAVTFVGNPAPGPFYTDRFVEYFRPATPPTSGCPAVYVASYEDTGVDLPSIHTTVCPEPYPNYDMRLPFVGGGVSMLWTPDFGAALLATNWSPLTHHGLVGLGDHPSSGVLERTWERYATTSFVRADRDGLEIGGTLPMYYDSPDELTYARRYAYADQSLEVEVTVTNETGAERTLDALWENLPVPLCAENCERNRRGRPVWIADASGTPLDAGEHALDAVRVVDGDGHGFAIEVLEGSGVIGVRPVGIRQVIYGMAVHIGRVEIPFVRSTLAAGEAVTVRYRLRTLDPIAVAAPGLDPIDEPQIVCAPLRDGGPMVDGGDGGGLDAGVGLDAGAGGDGLDAGVGDGPGGCGCRAAPAPAPTWLWSIWATVILFRRRRSRE